MNRNFRKTHVSIKTRFSSKQLFLHISAICCSGFFSTLPTEAEPKIRFDKTLHDFGSVEEGIDISCKFIIHNDGDKALKITETKSTCGCTVAAVKQKSIPAKASEELTVMMDTSMKQGPVKKEITIKSNDPENPSATIFITADVENPHRNLGKNVQAKIFSGRCAACHVNEGVGKLGEDLYLADCAMCHGFRAKGGVGPGLLGLDYENKVLAKGLRKIIAEGSPTNRSMPGFATTHGGPLKDAEIDSLINYLSWRSKLEKQK